MQNVSQKGYAMQRQKHYLKYYPVLFLVGWLLGNVVNGYNKATPAIVIACIVIQLIIILANILLNQTPESRPQKSDDNNSGAG
jgi:hypothetical protein